jgi:hypothetical protein
VYIGLSRHRNGTFRFTNFVFPPTALIIGAHNQEERTEAFALRENYLSTLNLCLVHQLKRRQIDSSKGCQH